MYFRLPALPEYLIAAGDYFDIEDVFQGKEMGVKNKENITAEDVEAFKFSASQPGKLSSMYIGRWALLAF